MKKYILLTFTGLLWLFAGSMQAQPFFGYQTIGTNTWFVSVSWDGQPHLGVGYQYRNFGSGFTDLGVEWRVPVANGFQFQQYQVLAGAYRPLAVRRWFLGTGLHLRYRQGEGRDLSLLATAIPSYTYAASLNDGPYGTLGLRLGYEIQLLAQSGGGWNSFGRHGVNLGGHADLHLERTLGLSLNGILSRQWALSGSEAPASGWQRSGDLYMGSTYFLRR